MGDFGKDRLQFKVVKDMALPSLRPKFMIKVKDMLDTIRRLLCRALFGDLDISRFTANKIIIVQKNCL